MSARRVRHSHRAQCGVCGTVIESLHPWDSVTCTCGRLSLYGGPQRPQVYWKAEPGSSWTDLSEDDEDPDDDEDMEHDGDDPEEIEEPPPWSPGRLGLGPRP